MIQRVARLLFAVVVIWLGSAVSATLAVDKTWTPTSGASFFEDANWTPAGAPGADDKALILDPAVTALINVTGPRTINSFHLGEMGATGGNVRFSAGQLNVLAEGDARSHIGDRNSINSTFIMDGTAVLLFDQPLDAGGGGLGLPGGNQDLEIGAQTGASGALGKLELHDSAVLRISDDLKIGAENDGNGEVLIDGNAMVTVGSGVSVSEAARSKGKLTVGGNALLVSGNSAGAGNTAQGWTDEGYFTLSVNADPATADVLIRDSAKVYVRSLQQRNGLSNMTVQDNGEFHVFDTFAHAVPNLGVATVKGDPFGPQRASGVAEAVGSVFNLTLKNNAKVSIDSAMDNGTGSQYQGLALSGGNNRGAILTTGGSSTIDISDNASFIVQQNLYMTLASSDQQTGAASTLRIKGPDATVQIKGDLLMSYDPNLMLGNADNSTIDAVITSDTHTTIEVGDVANIANGNLSVTLGGYSPVGGETYTLISANSISGTSFRSTDFSMALLPAGLMWDLDIGATSVVLNVLGSLPGVPGDFNGNNVVDAADYVLWRNGGPLMNDPTQGVQPEDYAFWRSRFGQMSGSGSFAAEAVPEPSILIHLIMLLAVGLSWAGRTCR
jgi:hypothetical protein